MNSFEYIIATGIAADTVATKGRSFYTDNEWLDCIVFLFEQGHDQEYVRWITQSKHMEWAHLGTAQGKRAKGFIEYYYRHAVRIESMRRAELENS